MTGGSGGWKIDRGRKMAEVRTWIGGKKKGKERCGSFGNVKDMLRGMKRKGADEEVQEMGADEEEVFKRSKMTQRSPVKETGEVKIKELMERWRKEMEEVMKEIRRVKEWREDIKQLKTEIKEGIKEQGVLLRVELEEMRKKFGEREREWREEGRVLKRVY